MRQVPSAMDTNGHFAAVGSANDKTAYEHGVQVIDENKEFKYVLLCIPFQAIGGLVMTLQASAH